MKRTLTFALIALLAIFTIGCLVSGTFVVVDEFSFSGNSGFYHYLVDITNEADWEDHKDDIDDIDLVGFDVYFTNPNSTDVTFNVWIDDSSEDPYTSSEFSAMDANTTKILDGLTLPPGSSHLTYGNSFAYIKNVPTLKSLVKSGAFHFYGSSSTGGSSFTVDSGQVIVTFSAHGS